MGTIMNTPDQAPSPIREKWGPALDGGFVVLPAVFLRKQRELQLNCEDMVVISHLIASWWEADKLPFPRTETIASRSGLSRRTVQRRLKHLEGRGMLTRVLTDTGKARRVMAYDLGRLVETLKELGAAEGALRKERANNQQ
jgi:predicted transcriptional regulator